MNKQQAKAYVCGCAAVILENGGNEFLRPDGSGEADRRRIKEAFDDLVAELERRGENAPDMGYWERQSG